MEPPQFPQDLILHPQEVRKVDHITNREERWIPGKEPRVEDWQPWRRLTLPREARVQNKNQISILPVLCQETLKDCRSALRKIFSFGRAAMPPQKVHEEMFAPLGKHGANITVQVLTAHIRHFLLVWCNNASSNANEEMLQRFNNIKPTAIEILDALRPIYLIEGKEFIKINFTTAQDAQNSQEQLEFIEQERKRFILLYGENYHTYF